MKYVRSIRGKQYTCALIAENSYSPASEAYRILRTNLLQGGDKLGSILVTSPASGDGKSITCANLGLAMSQNEQRVVILDADLRMPSQHLIFDTPPGKYAMVLHQQERNTHCTEEDIDRLAVEISPNLSLIPAGLMPGYPAELLGSARFESMLAALTDSYDVVIIDSPPVGLVTDAAILAAQVDGVVLVLDYGQQQRRAALRAVKALANDQINLVGTVINRAPKPGRRSRYGFSYNSELFVGAVG